MPKRSNFSDEFKQEAVRRLRASKDVATTAVELGIDPVMLTSWLPTVDADKPPALTSNEREELEQLRRDKARLEMEVEILGRAAAFFANRGKAR